MKKLLDNIYDRERGIALAELILVITLILAAFISTILGSREVYLLFNDYKAHVLVEELKKVLYEKEISEKFFSSLEGDVPSELVPLFEEAEREGVEIRYLVRQPFEAGLVTLLSVYHRQGEYEYRWIDMLGSRREQEFRRHE